MIERTKVKLSKPWGRFPAGHVIAQLDKRVAKILVDQGRAEYPEPPKPKRKRKRKKQNEPIIDNGTTADDTTG